MVARSIRKMTFFPGKSSFAKAKAAMLVVSVLSARTVRLMIALFLMPVTRFAALQTST